MHLISGGVGGIEGTNVLSGPSREAQCNSVSRKAAIYELNTSKNFERS